MQCHLFLNNPELRDVAHFKTVLLEAQSFHLQSEIAYIGIFLSLCLVTRDYLMIPGYQTLVNARLKIFYEYLQAF